MTAPRLRFLAIALTLLVATPLAAAAPRTETKPYVATPAQVNCHMMWPSSGGACFLLDGSESTVTITLQDATGLPVRGAYGFVDNSPTGPLFPFCNSVTASVPAGDYDLIVFVEAAFSPSWCAGTTPPTAGTITVTFR